MDDHLYAAIGRKQLELDTLNQEYDRLLSVLANVISLEIAPARVVVDLASRRWSVESKGETVAEEEVAEEAVTH